MTPVQLAERQAVAPLDDVTRRGFITGLGATSLALAFLAACGDDDSSAESDIETRSVEDSFGSVEVPVAPKRVIATAVHHVGNMLGLGMVPVGMLPDPIDLKYPGYAERLRDVAVVRTEDWGLDVEKALALQPDLVIDISGQPGDPWNQESCERSKQTLTTVCLEYGYTHEEHLKRNLTTLANVLGRDAEAEALLADYDARVQSLRTKVHAAGLDTRPVAHVVLTSYSDTGFFVPIDRGSNALLRAVGIRMPDFQNDLNGSAVEFSLERLQLLSDAFAIVVFAEGEAVVADLERNDVWRLLPPVRAGRVVVVDETWGGDYIPAMLRMCEDIESKLLPLTRT